MSLACTLRWSALVVVTLSASACGGGSGGGSGGSGNGGNGGEPPPPQEPPIVTTPTAVRVTRDSPFGAACLAVPAGATAYVNAEVEPHLAVDPSNPNHLVAAWQQDRMSDGGARGLASAVSVDGGATWSNPQPAPFSQCAGGTFVRTSDPWVAVNGATALKIGIAFTGAVLSAGARSAVLVSRSADGGTTWGNALALADDDGAQFFNDKETLTIDSADPRHVYAIWDRLDTTDSGPTRLARSTDGGVSWAPTTTIYHPGAGRQTIGNVIVTTRDGVVHAFFTELGPAAGNPAQTEGHIAVIRSNDKGLTWSAATRVAQLLAVGTVVPTQPPIPVRAGEILGTFAADPDTGTLYAAWQDARFSSGARDGIALARSTDGGNTWSPPVQVNANASVPAFTPTLFVLPGGVVGVTYYDLREAGTPAYQPANVWLAVSRDGTTWRETRLAGGFDLLDAPNANGLFVGDYHGLSGDGANFVALYARTNNGATSNRTDVFADRVNANSVVAAELERPAGDMHEVAVALDGSGDGSRKATAPALSPAAEARVSTHLSAVREMRRQQWRDWLE